MIIKPETALVLGGARSVWADREAAMKLFQPIHVLATNETGRDLDGRVDHWVSMHPEKMSEWVRGRAKLGNEPALNLWKPKHKQPFPGLEMKSAPSWGGSSGLLAVTVALIALEVEFVIVAGCPLLNEECHYFDQKVWREAHQYRAAWVRYLPQMRNRVKSMSGWTRELLGEPDMGWLGAHARAEQTS